MEASSKKTVRNINKPVYILFIVAGACFIIAGNISQAVVFFGLALVFDPFDVRMPFPKRPLYQKAWLMIHLAIVLALFVVMFFVK